MSSSQSFHSICNHVCYAKSLIFPPEHKGTVEENQRRRLEKTTFYFKNMTTFDLGPKPKFIYSTWWHFPTTSLVWFAENVAGLKQWWLWTYSSQRSVKGKDPRLRRTVIRSQPHKHTIDILGMTLNTQHVCFWHDEETTLGKYRVLI